MTELKPFQEATVRAVLAAFDKRRRTRRFLVADEVGLGKTVVAQHVIRRMSLGLGRPLVVFYMCSNLAIARQNRRKLLELLPPEERVLADCPVDRLSLLTACDRCPIFECSQQIKSRLQLGRNMLAFAVGYPKELMVASVDQLFSTLGFYTESDAEQCIWI
jgi:hypothetical protein